MQRKNGILKRAFAMISAIIVILVISTIMALSIAFTTETSKRTVDLYLYEQAALYSKSAAELALLHIAKNGCVNSINTTFDDESGNPLYDANITMRYIFTGTVVNGGTPCTDYFNIVTPEQNGSVLMDITIGINDPAITSEPIRYFRRTIQKL